MKLLTYHIENYGKIQNADGSFQEGLTCICEANGFGKTTLASFLKAMFYGLPTYKSTSKFNERQHFYPFNGGKFGGNVTFEWEGKVYKIERFFDEKTGVQDSVAMYCNGSLCTGFGEEIGKGIFGLDEASFKKTVFITLDELDIASTHSINEKLNHSVQSIDGEDVKYEKALEILEKAKKRLKAGRGNNDLISATQEEIRSLQEEIRNLTDMGESLRKEYRERERLMQEIAETEEQEKFFRERKLLAQKWETFDEKRESLEKTKAELCFLKEKYPLGRPSEEERQILASAVSDRERLQGQLSVTAFGAEKEEKLSALEEKFACGKPSEERLDEMQGKITRLGKLSEQAKTGYEFSAQEEELLKKFKNNEPSKEGLNATKTLVEKYKKKENERNALSSAITAVMPTQKGKGNKGALALFALLTAVGVGVLFVHTIAGGILLGLGAIGVVATLLLKGGKTPAENALSVNVQLATLNGELTTLAQKIHGYTVPYGYYTGNALVDFGDLERDFSAYQALLTTIEKKDGERAKAETEADMLRKETEKFLLDYGENSENLQIGLNRLSFALQEYERLLLEKENAEKNTADAKAKLQFSERKIAEILQKYGLGADAVTQSGLSELDFDCKRYEELRKSAEEKTKDLEEYRDKNALTERTENAETDVDLNGKLSELRRALANCDKLIAETERETEKLPDKETELTLARERLDIYKKKHDLLDRTMKALKGAEQSLKDKHITPIRERFSYYAQVLEKILDEKVEMDQDFCVKFERGGQTRSDKHLSAGERSLCALCMRLALVDNMYETEKPFIIMDDPFVHLDEKHLKRALELLKTLSQDKQILYFCCHRSRAVQ